MSSFHCFPDLPPEIQAQIWHEHFRGGPLIRALRVATRTPSSSPASASAAGPSPPVSGCRHGLLAPVAYAYTHTALDPATGALVWNPNVAAPGLLANRWAYETYQVWRRSASAAAAAAAAQHSATLASSSSPSSSFDGRQDDAGGGMTVRTATAAWSPSALPVRCADDLFYLADPADVFVKQRYGNGFRCRGMPRRIAVPCYRTRDEGFGLSDMGLRRAWPRPLPMAPHLAEILLVQPASTLHHVPRGAVQAARRDEWGFVRWDSLCVSPGFEPCLAMLPVIDFQEGELALAEMLAPRPLADVTVRWVVDIDGIGAKLTGRPEPPRLSSPFGGLDSNGRVP